MSVYRTIGPLVCISKKQVFSRCDLHKYLLATRNCDLYLDENFGLCIKNKMKLKDPIWKFLEITENGSNKIGECKKM